MHIIEELQMFDKPQPIESMVISSAQVSTAVVFNQGSATPKGSMEVLQGVIQLKKK